MKHHNLFGWYVSLLIISCNAIIVQYNDFLLHVYLFQRTVNTDMIKQLIKMMKSNCGKLGTANKVYCLISTWMWIALQDPEKKSVSNIVSTKRVILQNIDSIQ